MNRALRDSHAMETAVPGISVAELFAQTRRAFADRGLQTPDLDARLLLCAACGMTHEDFAERPERAVAPGEHDAYLRMSARRLHGEPVSRILGRREFLGLTFRVTPDTLDPRPDTETLVEAALDIAAQMSEDRAALDILDLGTGSGCILVSLLHHLPHARGVGVDINSGAAEAARANARRHAVGARSFFFCGSWLESVAARFDMIVANPPYIPAGDIDALAVEVAAHDPRAALDGGDDGLDAYRTISSRLARILKPGGWALFETGAGQPDAVEEILLTGMPGASSSDIRRWRDLSGRERCIGLRAPIERR